MLQTTNGSNVCVWCEKLAAAILAHRGPVIARCVDPDYVLNYLKPQEVLATKQAAFEAFCARYDKGVFRWSPTASLKNVLVPLFRIIQEKLQPTPRLNLIAHHAIQAVNGWIELYRSCEASCCNWMIPALVTLLSLLGTAGLQADQQQADVLDVADDSMDLDEARAVSDSPSQTANQQNVLNTIRQHIGKFRGDENRQAGYVVLLSESIQACIMLGNIQMASSFLKTVESSNLNVSRIPRDPLVSFKYYLGKLYMQQEKFYKAEDALAWAYSFCHSNKKELKRKIIQSLIAVRLRMGKLPSESFLKTNKLDHYLEIVHAIRSGNIKRFESVLFEQTARFVEEGTLLCVEKIKFIVYRTLFKRAIGWARENMLEGESRNIIPLALFTAAFKFQLSDDFIEFDDEEMACITANLIKLGYIKGYIAWDHRKIVLSKTQPVPPLNSVTIS